jgi:uncharacterized protein (DUF885 family)
MKFVELRERARRELGDHFDLCAFHDAVLADGPLPLDVLEANVDRWVSAEKETTAGGLGARGSEAQK